MARLRRTQSAITLALLFVTTGVQASAPVASFVLKPLPARLLPEYTACTYQGTRFACFTAEQMIELNTLEIQARYWHDQWEDHVQLLATKEKELLKANEQIQIHIAIERSDLDQITKLSKSLVTEIKAKNDWRAKAENPPTWPLWVGGTAGLLGLGAFLGSLLR